MTIDVTKGTERERRGVEKIQIKGKENGGEETFTPSLQVALVGRVGENLNRAKSFTCITCTFQYVHTDA